MFTFDVLILPSLAPSHGTSRDKHAHTRSISMVLVVCGDASAIVHTALMLLLLLFSRDSGTPVLYCFLYVFRIKFVRIRLAISLPLNVHVAFAYSVFLIFIDRRCFIRKGDSTFRSRAHMPVPWLETRSLLARLSLS